MARQFSAVLFDLDGTLVDTAADFIAVLNAQRAAHGLTALPDGVIRNTVSDGARALIRLAFGGDEGEAEFEAQRQELLGRYQQQVGACATLFEGFDALLEELEQIGIAWGIVTNKPRLYTELLLERIGLSCPILVCADDLENAKPDPEGLLLACRTLYLDSSQCIYVGDHERDIQAARNANMPSIAAGFGYLKDDAQVEDWQADYIADTPAELVALLISLCTTEL